MRDNDVLHANGTYERVAGHTGRRVLIVDDDTGTRELFSRILKRGGYHVTSVAALSDALATVRRREHDIVLLDARLGSEDGLTLLRELRADGILVPVAVVTGFGSVPLVVDAMRTGASEVVEKPVEPEMLLDVVRRNLSRTCIQARSAAVAGTDSPLAHAAAHVSSAIVRILEAHEDPRTIAAWVLGIAASPGALRNWCQNAGVTAKAALDLARVLRAVLLAQRFNIPVHQLFDTTDRRTRTRLLREGGLHQGPLASIADVLDRQTIVQDPVFLAELERALRQVGILHGENA